MSSGPAAPMPAIAPGDRELTRRRQKRRALFFVATVVPLFVIADLLIAPDRLHLTLPLRLAWSAWVLVLGWPALRQTRVRFQWSIALAAAGSSAFYLAICAASGGAQSPLFAWNLAVPLAVAVVAQDELPAVLAGVATSWFGTLLLLLAWGEPPRTTAMWLTLLLASVCVAVYAGITYQRLRVAEDESEDARLLALRRLAESEARRAGAERLALLGRLSAGVAHEVNNPLNILTLNLELIERAPEALLDPEKRTLRLRALREATDRIGHIVTDLRSWAREAEDPTPSGSVREALEVALRLSSLRLRSVSQVQSRIPNELPRVAIGARHLSQVLVNLLVNAGDALEEAKQDDPWIQVEARVTGDQVELIVEDNGPGIPAALRGKLFQEVVTTKPMEKGTGLGLTICRDYVERAGGRLGFEDRPGGGTRFWLRLPIVG